MNQSKGVLFGRALIRFLLVVIVIRLVRDTGQRMMFPFLPVYAEGFGLTLTTIGMLMTVRTGLVVLAPYFGSIADHRGPHKLLTVGYVVLSVGLLTFSFAQGLASALLAVFLLGVSDAMIMPLAQAYVSEHSPPQRRGRALATVEYSWAISGIVALPIVGWLIAQAGWQLPFRLLSLASLLCVLLLVFVLPGDLSRQNRKRPSLWRQATNILRDRSAAGTLLTNAAIFVAAETIFVIWGAHLTRDFDLGPAQIGFVASLIGIAELVGSVVSSLIIDKTGKRRGVIGGVSLFLFALLLMPILNQALATLVFGLAFISMCLEYSIVSTIPLIGQQRPSSRATMLAMGAMMGAVSRSFTDTIATSLFDNISFLATVFYAIASLIIALLMLWRLVEEREET